LKRHGDSFKEFTCGFDSNALCEAAGRHACFVDEHAGEMALRESCAVGEVTYAVRATRVGDDVVDDGADRRHGAHREGEASEN
jgi:hypothetical protein